MWCKDSELEYQSGLYRDFKSAIQGAFFTDKQFNYQLTAEEARKLCTMFSKSAARRLYVVQLLLPTATQHTLVDAVVDVKHGYSMGCSRRVGLWHCIQLQPHHLLPLL